MAVGALSGCVAPYRGGGFELASPNRRVLVTVAGQDGGPVRYTIFLDERVLIASSPVGMELEGQPSTAGAQILSAVRNVVDESFVLPTGKARLARNHCNQLTLTLGLPSGGAAMQLVFRAYDDGVAFRCRVAGRPVAGSLGTALAVRGEITRFDFPADFTCWGANLHTFQTAHESEFSPARASALDPRGLFDAPLVCQANDTGVTFALAEADLVNYAACYFVPRSDGLGVGVRLSPRLDDPSIAVRLAPGEDAVSPWRVVMIADHPGRLIESTLISALNPPPHFADTTWIEPGKAAWDWWSGVSSASRGGMTNAIMLGLIDFAATNGLQYLLIDAGWYVVAPGSGSPGRADLTRTVAEIDLPALVKAGRRRGVGIFLWMHWGHLAAQFDPALDFCAAHGVRGIKVDFLNRDDQDMVAFVHRLLAATAARQLMLNLHGMYHPTGLSRTYPNLLTQEGVLGAEYNKWSRRVTAIHNVTLPFTRMLLGPMDYTPGGFRNATPASFVARDVDPMVQTTRGQSLAMYVVFESPFSCVSDSTAAYAGQAGFDFLVEVPTSWDETRVLAGEIGQFVMIARRAGTDWFVGAMTNEKGRILLLPLNFLAAGNWVATIYQDVIRPTDLHILYDQVVHPGESLTLQLAASGGAAIRFRTRGDRGASKVDTGE